MDRHRSDGGSPLRRTRERKHLSPEGLAAKAGVTLRTIERIESGHVKHPHGSTQKVIAEALGVEVTEIWPLDSEVPAA
jgi:transcriptional regulator with XRE-family HTH domain